MPMATLNVFPASSGLGITFNVEGCSSLPTSPFANQERAPSRLQNDPPQSSTFAALKTQRLRRGPYTQAQRLHGAMNRSVHMRSVCRGSSRSAVSTSSMASQVQQKESLIINPSIVDSSNFKLLYSDQYSLSHFARTKEELPLEIVRSNKELLKSISAIERGYKIDYQALRYDLDRLANESTIVGNSPRVFDFFNRLTASRDDSLEAGARFISYDLWLNMIKTYYGATNDSSLMSMIPVMNPTALENYLREAAIQLSPENTNSRSKEWARLREAWIQAEADLYELKASAECRLRFKQIVKLKEIFDHCYADKAKLARDQRRAQSALRRSEFREKRLAIRRVNSRNMRFQYGQEGMHIMPVALASQLGHDNAKHTTDYIADEQLPKAMQHINLQEYPDSMTSLSTQAG